MTANPNTRDATEDAERRLEELLAEVDRLERRLDSVDTALGRRRQDGDRRGADATSDGAARSRRQLFNLAGASAVGAVGGLVVRGAPAAAVDPNDVVKNISNVVIDTTTLDGSFPGPVLSLFNDDVAPNAGGLYASSRSPNPTVRADNDESTGLGGVAVAGNAPGGRDLHAIGSGRIAMDDHVFGSVDEYQAGEIHQSAGTLYAMVSTADRRVVTAPGAAGALFPIDPSRVYDSRRPLPLFGRISAGESRVVDVGDRRDLLSGAVDLPGLVPDDATAIVFNITVVDTLTSGYLSVTQGSVTEIAGSTINWSSDGETVANTSLAVLGSTGNVRVHCGGLGSTHFVLDVIGYHR